MHRRGTDKEFTASVSVVDVSFSYGGDSTLRNINLSIPSGDFLAVIGPNGGGKSTFLRLILGMLEPQTGTISVFGKRPCNAHNFIGYVPQYSTLKSAFPASVLDMVLMGDAHPSFLGGSWPSTNKAKEKAHELLSMLEIDNKTHTTISELSGGQRQRALIARALMGKPADDSPFLLLLDEPTASIDPAGKYCFYESLGMLRGNVTIILVSHEMFIGSDFFDHVVFINKTLTQLPEKRLTVDVLTTLFGEHQHACPLGDLQHASGIQHSHGCTHEVCQQMDNGNHE